MQNIFTDYPAILWRSGWKFSSGPEDRIPFITGDLPCAVRLPEADGALRLSGLEDAGTARLLCNGFSISTRKRPEENRIDVLATGPGLLYGKISGLPMPQLVSAKAEITKGSGFDLLQNGRSTVVLLRQENHFALVCGELTPDQALAKAEAVLDGNFESLLKNETETRKNICRLFSTDPRRNPSVALAAENLAARLRSRNGAINGLWSLADGFTGETFSLNELYPLTRAWSLIDPSIALELVQTALTLQQSSGGFPSWISDQGLSTPAAPWPFIAQSFELAWQNSRDPALLKKYLPALRKYIQWALRRFDPHRDGIPSWQSEQEIFVPQSFERGKATPELTVLLIAELEAVLRLCEAGEHTEAAAQSLIEERDRLVQTLYTVFWNPAAKAFSNVWKDGHYLQEPSFGSFMPLFWRGLDAEKQSALLETFEENRCFPGHQDSGSWKQDPIGDTVHLPAIHQFTAFEALRNTGGTALMLLIRRAREGFAAWFEHETAGTGRGNPEAAYALGPVTAALILAVQEEAERASAGAPSSARQILKWGRRLKINSTDLRIISVFLLAILIVHLTYTLPKGRNADARVAEAALNYQQGRYTDAMRICRRYPHHALACLLQANMLMLAEQTGPAEELYRQTLKKETGSPSALFGLALALQMNGNFEQAAKRYTDFIEIYEQRHPEAAQLADEFLTLALAKFNKPPRWRRVYALSLMNDLGL